MFAVLSPRSCASSVPLASDVVKTQKVGDVAVETLTDVDGKYAVQLSVGVFTITVNMSGYLEQSLTVTLNADEYKTYDFLMVAI